MQKLQQDFEKNVKIIDSDINLIRNSNGKYFDQDTQLIFLGYKLRYKEEELNVS